VTVHIRSPQAIVRRPIVLTEKGSDLRETHNQLIFEVAKDANKIEIKKAIETLFTVTVLQVNTMNVRGRLRRMGRTYGKTQNWKKAIVTLKKGDKIEYFEAL
jgi:large subunit ribosomal protein L23